jgi:hypothetical protein
MQTFFKDLDSIQKFTRSLDHHHDVLKCQFCSKNNHFVSHGFIYKKQYNGLRQTVGKRIFCSNRFGRSGCGRTFRVYLATEAPKLNYAIPHLAAFIYALIAGACIHKAYYHATKTSDSRNAYRWLNKLQHKLIDYRQVLRVRITNSVGPFQSRVRRLQLILPTLSALLSNTVSSCAHYQIHTQKPFV